MTKISFFLLSDYVDELHWAGRHLRASRRFVPLVAMALLGPVTFWIPFFLFGGSAEGVGWTALAWLLGLVGSVGLQVRFALLVRADFGLEADRRDGWDLAGSWIGLGAWVGLMGSLVLVPTWLPAFVAGVGDGLMGLSSTAPADLWPGNLARQIYSSLSLSALGALYLWLFPLAAFRLGERSNAVRREGRRVAWRTWPLGLGFAVLNLAVSFLPPGFWSTVSLVTTAVIGQAFFVLQLLALARRSAPRPGV